MRYRSLTLLAAAVLTTGAAGPIAAADSPPPAQVEPADPGQDALLQATLEAEEAFRGRTARLMRLRTLAEERADTERVMQIEDALQRLENRHGQRMKRHRAKLQGDWRSRLDATLRREAREERHEAREQRRDGREQRHDARRDARETHRDDRQDAREQRHDGRRAARSDRQGMKTVRDDRREQRRDLRRDGRSDRQMMKTDVRDDRREAAANAHDQRAKNGEQPRSQAGDRRAIRLTRPVMAGHGGRPKADIGSRRPVPAPRPAPGASFSLGRGAENGAASQRRPVKLSSPGDARARAASTISHDNADKEFARLLEEIERED